MPEEPAVREVLEVRPPKTAYGVGAAVSVVVALASAVLGYLEYAGRARPGLLSLSLSGACLGAAGAILLGFRFTFPFQTERAPRQRKPPNVMWEPPVAEALGLRLPAARRPFIAFLGGAIAGLAALLLLPLRSLMGHPRPDFRATAWRRGVRLMVPGGGAIRVEDLAVGAVVPVVPEQAPDDYNSLAVLVRLRESPSASVVVARDGAPSAPNVPIRAYSRICTHAGCTVSIFLDESGELVCPCHWSRFDAARGGAVLGGPASQALPELPLAIDAEGFVVASDDFNRPVGPLLGARNCAGCKGLRKRGAG